MPKGKKETARFRISTRLFLFFNTVNYKYVIYKLLIILLA